MRMPFDEIFDEVDGRLVPQFHIGIGPIAIAAGTSLSPALAISGIEIGKLKDRDLEVEVESGIIAIHGLFRDEAAPHSHRARPRSVNKSRHR